jgi:hypothetical protein
VPKFKNKKEKRREKGLVTREKDVGEKNKEQKKNPLFFLSFRVSLAQE